MKAAGGDLTKKDAMRDAMRKADYASVRGPYKYGNNHFPIQNFYLQEAVKDGDGFTHEDRRRRAEGSPGPLRREMHR